VPLVDYLAAAGVGKGTPLALVLAPGQGLALAWPGGGLQVPTGDPARAVRAVSALEPRWTWWAARETAAPLVDAGVHLQACWDLGAVGRLCHGLRRDDPAAVWAALHGLPEPAPPREQADLFDLFHGDEGRLGPVGTDGQLSPDWVRSGWARDLSAAERWAALAVDVQAEQEDLLRAVPDRRRRPGAVPLAVLTAWSESAAALLAVELGAEGLPLDRDVAGALLRDVIGERPADAAEEARQRRGRDEQVLRRFPGDSVDLRNPAQVRDLLAWRKAERTATTYGWGWLDRHVGADGRLRGVWGAADAAAGRMTAQAGLHNLPAELRPAVRAEAGHVLVRTDLGQVEPRVLAAVSGDEGLARAAREDDMYAPVARQLGCDRPTAKVAVLAAMYGQTSGTAGAALRDMDRAYPAAMAHLRAAEEAGRAGRDLRTYGGRLLRLSGAAPTGEPVGEHVAVPAGRGRFARNAVVQGAAAELFKAWAATVRSALPPLRGRIVLCLHDEVLVHVPAEHAQQAVTLVRTALEATARWWAAGSGVRFVADVSVGESWAEAH
jgi:DNA polymerase-1